MALRSLVLLVSFGMAFSSVRAQMGGQPVPASTPPGFSEYDAGAHPKIGLEKAQFRWWAPANTKLRGVLVLVPGRGGDGRGMAANPEWQALATKIQFGIVACFLLNPKDNPFQYQGDPNGAVSALVDKSVNTILAQNKIPLQNPPLAFWGHSAGGNVTQNFCSRYPNRVVGAVLMRCPAGPGALTPGKESIPILVCVGQKDKPDWVRESVASYEKGRAARALWTLALHPNEGHEIGKTQALASAHLAAAVALRLPPPSPFATEAASLKRLSRETGWLGDPSSYEVGPALTLAGQTKNAVWLLDAATAKIWQDYLRAKP